MKIVKLILENFGIYANSNTLDLHSGKPIILIGGMNGRGKTTILEAILLALYGRRSFAFEESNLAFPKYLSNLVNIADKSFKTKIELEFEMQSEKEVTVYTVIREWSFRTQTPALKTSVRKNGLHDTILSENWDLFIEEMLPSAIAPFFFFDGEKIAELASADNNIQMKDSIKTLLGIHVIDHAVSDIQKIINTRKKSVKSDSFEKEIAEYEEKLTKADAKIKASKEQTGILRAKTIKLESKLNEAENAFSSMGGNLAINRKDLLTKQAVLLERLERINTQIIDISAGDLPLLLTLPLLENVLSVSINEREQKNIRAALEQLPSLFRDYSKDKKIGLKFEDFINYIKSTATDDAPVYSLSDMGHYQVQALCKSLSNQHRTEAKNALLEREKIQKELVEVENYLSLNVDETEAGKQHKEILRLTFELATVKEQLRMALITETADMAAREELSKNHQKMIEKEVNMIEGADDTKRIIQYSGLTIQVLQEYKIRLQAQKTRHLATTMTDCFKHIASKQSLIREIIIDETSLEFHYFNSSGNEVSHSSFSAGEKQLLVIAMLWALGICSKKQLPVIIDTPLARLDSVHRKALITNYFPRASEQTILLSTDSEIHGSYYEMIKPFVDKEYTLVYDDNTKRSSVEIGYFGGAKK